MSSSLNTPSSNSSSVFQPNTTLHSHPTPKKDSKPTIHVSKLVKETCSVYMSKGRINNTASKLIATKNKCIRIGK